MTGARTPIGALDRVMRLERPERSVSPQGEATTVFAEAGTAFVALAPAALAETAVAGRIDGIATHRAELRAPTPVAGGWRLVDGGGRIFRVLGVDDAGARSGRVTCLVEEEGR